MVKKISLYFLIINFILINLIVLAENLHIQPLKTSSNQKIDNNNTYSYSDYMTDIHDINQPIKYGFTKFLFNICIVIFVILLISGLLFFLYKYYQKKKGKEYPRIIFQIPADEVALKLLDELETSTHLDGKIIYFKLSNIFREYIVKRFKIDALEMTSEELLPNISILDLNKNLFLAIKKFLQRSDSIKFAEIPPEYTSIKKDIEFVKTFVKKTTRNDKEKNNHTNDTK